MIMTRGRFVPSTLDMVLRSALVSVARALWILLPDHSDERCLRALGEAYKEAKSDLLRLGNLPSLSGMA